jgi:3-oxoadipate enol-lactonase
MGKSSRLWYAWPPLLATSYRVVRPDHRGYGKSSVPPPGYQWSLSNFARDLRDLIDHLGLEKIHLIGETIGGAVSLQFAYEYPERLLSMTLSGAPYTLASAQEQQHFADERKQIREEGVAAWANFSSPRRFGKSPEYQELAKWYASEMAKSSRRVMLETFEFLPTIDLTAELPFIQVPTLILAGQESAIAPLGKVQQMQKLLPNSQLAIVPNAPNQVHAVMPDKCVKEWLKFVSDLKPSAP